MEPPGNSMPARHSRFRGDDGQVATRPDLPDRRQTTAGSLNASISSLKSLIGTQLQNTFLSP